MMGIMTSLPPALLGLHHHVSFFRKQQSACKQGQMVYCCRVVSTAPRVDGTRLHYRNHMRDNHNTGSDFI